jgi:hypothetical protein
VPTFCRRESGGATFQRAAASEKRPGVHRALAVSSVDLVRAVGAAGHRAHRARLAVPVVAVRVAERERRMRLEAVFEARTAFLPPLLVLELVLVQRRGLADAVRVAELDRETRRLASDLVPRRECSRRA